MMRGAEAMLLSLPVCLEFLLEGVVQGTRMDMDAPGLPRCFHLNLVAFANRGLKAEAWAVGEAEVGEAIHNAQVGGSLRYFDQFMLAETRTSFC